MHQFLIKNLPDAFTYYRIVTDGDGNPADYVFLEVNAAFEEMTGLYHHSFYRKHRQEKGSGFNERSAQAN